MKWFHKNPSKHAFLHAKILDVHGEPIPSAILKILSTNTAAVSNSLGVLEGNFPVGLSKISIEAPNRKKIIFNLSFSASDSVLLEIKMKIAEGVTVE